MPTKAIESMIAWSRNAQQKLRFQSRAGVSWVRTSPPPAGRELRRITIAAVIKLKCAGKPDEAKDQEAKSEWVVDETRKPCRGVGKDEREVMANCTLLRFDGEEAECSVRVSGYDLPSVSFPAWVLRAKGLGAGKRFIWTIRDASHISPNDIDPDVGTASWPQLPDEQQKQIDELHEASVKRRKTQGTDWPEFTGPSE